LWDESRKNTAFSGKSGIGKSAYRCGSDWVANIVRKSEKSLLFKKVYHKYAKKTRGKNNLKSIRVLQKQET